MKRLEIINLNKKFKGNFKIKKGIIERYIGKIRGEIEEKERRILKDINFDLKGGEIIGIIGKNGAGKTTLLRTIAGIYEKDYGEIKINGKIIPLIRLNSIIRPNLTLKQNIDLMLSFMCNKDKKKLDEIIKKSGLWEYKDTKVKKLSTGMLERIDFILAINCNPDILLIDEGFGTIDKRFNSIMEKDIKEMIKRKGSIIIASHNLEDLEKKCNKIIWLENGEIKEMGKPKEIIKKYTKR